MEEEPKETVETGEEGKEVEEANKEENETKTKSDESTEDAKMLPSEEDALLENEEGETEGNEEINEEELLGEEEGEEEAMGDSEGEEIPEDGQEEGLCMDEEEGEIMDELAEDEEQFPDSNLDDEGNEFPEDHVEGDEDSRSDSGGSDGAGAEDDGEGLVVHRNVESGSRELRRQVHMRHKFVDKGESEDRNYYTPKGMSQSPYKGAYQCPYCESIYSFRGDLFKHLRRKHHGKEPLVRSGQIPVLDLKSGKCEPIRAPPRQYKASEGSNNYRLFASYKQGYTFSNKNNQASSSAGPKVKFKCPLCSNMYLFKANLNKHCHDLHGDQYAKIKSGEIKVQTVPIAGHRRNPPSARPAETKPAIQDNRKTIIIKMGENGPTSSVRVPPGSDTDDLRYKCPLCNMSYTNKTNLIYRHVRQSHPSHYEDVKAGSLKIKILRAGSGAVVANESAKNLARNKTEAKDLSSLLNSKGIRNKQNHGEGEVDDEDDILDGSFDGDVITASPPTKGGAGALVGETDTSEVLYRCPICAFTSGSREYLISRHIKDRHPARFHLVKSGVMRITCTQAGRDVDSVQYQCPGCNKTMASKRALLHKHIKNSHPGMSASITAGIIEIKAIGRKSTSSAASSGDEGGIGGVDDGAIADESVDDADFSVENPYYDMMEESRTEPSRASKRKTLPSSAVPQQGMELSLEGTIQPMPEDFAWKVRGCDVMYKCPLCPRMNMFRGNLLRYHMTREHPGSREAVLAGTLQVRRVLVQRSFNTRAPSDSHHTPLASSAIDIDGFRFKCPFCNSTYANMWDLLHKHMYTYHPQHQDDCKRGIIEIPVCTDADVGGRHKTWKGLPGPEGKGLANNSVAEDSFDTSILSRTNEDTPLTEDEEGETPRRLAITYDSLSPPTLSKHAAPSGARTEEEEMEEEDEYEDFVPSGGYTPAGRDIKLVDDDDGGTPPKQKKVAHNSPMGMGPKGGVPRQAPSGQVFSCKYCGVGYHWASNIRRHCLKHHVSEYEEAMRKGEPSYVVTNTDKQTGDELRQKIRCLDCYSLMGNHMAMKKHISVHHVYLFDKEFTSAAEPGSETRTESSIDETLQCQICHLWFEEEFGLANHYSREHFDRIRSSAEDETAEGASASAATEVGDAASSSSKKTPVKVVGSGETVAMGNLGDDIEEDGYDEKENNDLKIEDIKDEKVDQSDGGDKNSKCDASTSSDTTPRRSSRRHALKNANPQQVRQHSEDDDCQRAPSCIDTSRDGISRIPSKQDGNEATVVNGSLKTTAGRVPKRDSEEGKNDDILEGALGVGRGLKRRAEDDDEDNDGAEEELEEKGEVKEEGARSLGAGDKEDDVEISPAKKGGLQCPLCPTSCNYRSLLLNHIKKFHPVDGEHYWKELMQERYKCPLCTAIYKNDFDLPRHIKKVHPKYFRPNATITYKPLSKPPDARKQQEIAKEPVKAVEAKQEVEEDGVSNSSIEDNEDRNLEIAEEEPKKEKEYVAEDEDDDVIADQDDGNETTLDDSALVPLTPRGGGEGGDGEPRYPEEIEGVSVHPNDKSNPPPPHWHDPDRDGLWVHYKVKEEGKIERLWVYIVPQPDGTSKYQCPTCPAIYSHKHDVPRHIRRKHRVAKPADATQRLSTPYNNTNNSNNSAITLINSGNGLANGVMTSLAAEQKDAAETHMSTDVVEGSDGDSPGRGASAQSAQSSDFTQKCLYCTFVSSTGGAMSEVPEHIRMQHPSFYETFIEHIWPKILKDNEGKTKQPLLALQPARPNMLTVQGQQTVQSMSGPILIRAGPKSVKERQANLEVAATAILPQQQHVQLQHAQQQQTQSSLVGRFECPSCFSTYGTYSNVVRHIKTKHPLNIEELVKDIMVYESVSAEEAGLTKDCQTVGGDVGVLLLNCSICHLEFISEDGLKKHVEDAHPEVAAKGGKLVVLMRNGGDASSPLRGDVLHPSTLQQPQIQPMNTQIQQLQQHHQQHLTPDFCPNDEPMGDYIDDEDEELMQQSSGQQDGAYIVPELQYGDDNSQSLYCSQCNVSFKHRKYLMAHIRKKHPDRRYVCSACPAMFKSHSDLLNHHKDFHSNVKFKCAYCNMNYKSSKGLFAHLKTMHPNAPMLKDLNSSLYDADRGELASPDSVPGRDLDLLDAAATSAPSGVSLPPAIAPVIGAPTGFRSAGAAGIVLAATSTPTSSGAGAHHESVFAGGTYELEHPVNRLGNDLRNDAFGNRDDDDSGSPGLAIDRMPAIKEERMVMDHDANDGSDEEHRADRDFPMPALSSIQTGGRQQLQPMAIRSSSGGTTTLMLRSLLTGANVPVVASGAVAPGVVSQTTPVTLEPVTATESTGPPEDNRAAPKPPKKMKCSDCPFVTSVSVVLLEHTRMHQIVTEFRCPHCSFSSPIREELVQHQLLHFGNLLLATN